MTVLAPIGRMPQVAQLMEKLPDLTLVIDHMADCPVNQPREFEKLIALKRFPNVFVKTSHTWSLSRHPYRFQDGAIAIIDHCLAGGKPDELPGTRG